MVRVVFIIGAAMILAGCNIQNSMLYFPSAALPTTAALTAMRLKPWPSTSTLGYRGLVASADLPSAQGTIVVWHGNGGTALDRVFYVETLADLGYRVILAEYPSYGGRPGELGEESFVYDAVETVRLAHDQFGAPLFLLGESLGCGVAAAVAREAPVAIAGIVLLTPWDTLAAIARAKFPFLPVRLLLTDTYDNIANLESFSGRIAVIGAGRDEIVPVGHADNLFRSLVSTAKRLWLVKEAGHNDLIFYTNQAWWREVMDFVGGKGQG